MELRAGRLPFPRPISRRGSYEETASRKAIIACARACARFSLDLLDPPAVEAKR
jgi:hypothetical protein